MYRVKIQYEQTSPLRGVIEKISDTGEVNQVFVMKNGDRINTIPYLGEEEGKRAIDFCKSVAMV